MGGVLILWAEGIRFRISCWALEWISLLASNQQPAATGSNVHKMTKKYRNQHLWFSFDA